MNYCPIDETHDNWYGALFCGVCGVRMRERIVRCKVCSHNVTGGNSLVKGWGTNYCTLCGAPSTKFEVIDKMAEGRADLLPEDIRKQVLTCGKGG